MKITKGGTVKYVKTYPDAVNGALAVGKDGRVAIGGRKLYSDDEAFIAVYDSFGLFKTNGKFIFKGTSFNRDQFKFSFRNMAYSIHIQQQSYTY